MPEPREVLNRVLGFAGLSTLDDPTNLVAQIAFLIQDHDHYRVLLMACEPEHRTAMYEATKSNLSFKAWPLEDYIIKHKALAEAMQYPLIGSDGALKPFRSQDVDIAQAAVNESFAKGHLTLTCRSCTVVQSFPGERRADAIFAARKSGWTYDEIKGDGMEICPNCP